MDILRRSVREMSCCRVVVSHSKTRTGQKCIMITILSHLRSIFIRTGQLYGVSRRTGVVRLFISFGNLFRFLCAETFFLCRMRHTGLNLRRGCVVVLDG